MTPSQIAWLAGIVEGEGHIRFEGRAQVKLIVVMTDGDVIKKCHKISGLGMYEGPIKRNQFRKDGSRCKDIYKWKVYSRDPVEKILKLIRPWMGKRRGTRIDQGLKRLKNNYRAQDVTHCPKGHPYNKRNTYLKPRKKAKEYVVRSCGECARIYGLKRYYKLKKMRVPK